MDVIFLGTGFSPKDQGEIDAVLQRIAVGNQPGEWSSLPDVIQILRRLPGGRSGSQVLDVLIKRDFHEARKIIKLGPGYEIKNEFQAFRTYLRDSSNSFVRIEAATPGILGQYQARTEETEAVVYDHAARFAGNPHSDTHTFEDVALPAIRGTGAVLEKAITILKVLLTSVRNDLYEKYHVDEQETTLQKSWNRRLGIDAVVAIDRVVETVHQKKLESSAPTPYGAKQAELWPLNIASASVRVDGQAAVGDRVSLPDARMVWHGTRLIAEVDAHHLRIEVVADGSRAIDQLASAVDDGSRWKLHGRLVSLRMTIHRERLLTGLGEGFTLSNSILTGPGARVPDPFAALPSILESRRRQRITSVIHGDLNPRNILVINELPCLIDYALTRDGEPIFMDFARLEGCLVRDILPGDLSWAQHVRLQRLLAAACRLGDEAARRFAERLADDRAELASAFRLLWMIRQAACKTYPSNFQHQWVQDYLEQIFLFAHLTLKWDEEEAFVPHKMRATAAIAGVATEALADTEIYNLWSNKALSEDGDEIIQIVQAQRLTSLHELVSLARVLHRLDTKQDASLLRAFEQARISFVRQQFYDKANAVLNGLHNDHAVYISLKAYIDLKGQLRAGHRRQRLSPEEMLEMDEILAEGERLQERGETSENVLHLIAVNPAVVLIGDAGSGKSTVAREWEYCLASLLVDSERRMPSTEHNDSMHSSSPLSELPDGSSPVARPFMPLVLRAPDLPARLQNWKVKHLQSTVDVLGHDQRDHNLLMIGALYIIIDALNELAEEDKQRVADWIIGLREAFPRTPVLVCHRQYNYVPGLLPFPVVTLQKVKIDQARTYIGDYLREKGVPNHEQLTQKLIRLLLDNPDHAQVRDLAQTPLFLWMIVERYRETGEIPKSRGSMFETFSHWYLEQRYHEAHQEVTQTTYTYENKALLLGALGYELVQRRATDLPEQDIPRLVPRSLKDDWPALLEEIIAAEMLYRDGKKLRFLHQSFQEYFAARHFLMTQAKNPDAIRQKVWQLGWHDTFAVLLGFAGDATSVVTQVIEEALKVNPLLTARCLRMAEQPDPRLLERFVDEQETVLQNAHAGDFAHERAAQALAEHGRGPTRAALWRVVIATGASEKARVEALNRLAAMPEQVRFEFVAERIRQELISHLQSLFDEPAPITVQQAAIATIVTRQLKDLSLYLANLVEKGEWPLCRTAWQACNDLGIKPPPKLQVAFINACRERLDQTEEELFHESVIERTTELTAERVDILRQLATPANLPLLLKRRFSFAISDEVGEIIDQVVQIPGEPPVEAQEIWKILTAQPEDTDTARDQWLELLCSTNDLVAIAAAHRLMQFEEELPGEKLRPFLDPMLLPERLSIIAHLIQSCQDKSIVEPLEALIRSLMETVAGTQAFEAVANLVQALQALDHHLGQRVAAIINVIFWIDREDDATYRRYFPWCNVSYSIYLSNEDYQALLMGNNNDIRAAVFDLGQRDVISSLRVGWAGSPTILGASVMLQLQKLARSEQELNWQYFFASAATQVHAVDLLSWLIDLAYLPAMVKEQDTIYNYRYGQFEERYLSRILRAIGYLAHLLLNQKRLDEAGPAVTFLRERYAALQADEERSIIVGLTTGLGYLGDWEPILTHLGPGEPWMHEAARYVFEHWVPTSLKATAAKKQRKEAGIWIARRLRDCPDLSPQARSTLERIKEDLETEFGQHIQVEDA